MKKADASLSTGICALDNILEKMIPGDNVVWQVDSINEYIPFIEAFASHTLKSRKKLIYFRFAGHNELLTRLNGVIKHNLDPLVGFETFTSDIRSVIEKHGKRAHYIFDCLSDLPVYWYSDLMLGNFFVLICPYVWRQKSLAYFALIRYRHSLPVAARIRNTTQILIDAYHYGGELYIHPMKVDKRHSPTMYLPHICKDDSFRPVTDSATVSEVVSSVMGSEMGSASRVFDKWDRTFMEVQEIIDEIERGERPADDAQSIFEKLLHMIISRDKRVLRLATNYLGISDIFEIKKRLIGTGLIGGKSVGMLLARAILQKSNTQWKKLLEVHDSFYIGSDVFYTYIVLNKCWDIRQKQRDPDSFLDGIDEARQRMLTGEFPEFIQEQFVDMLDYFGQSPIIVRSSSLLEDNFGNAFSGKYESVFCVNQGTRTERLKAFLSAVRHVYASTMSKEALLYRARRGLLNHDEQMALLVQRVSGSVYGNIFFPQIAGVGLSFNPYSWSEKIDPEAGVLRLVCGLGTRAVERHDDDYTRVVALNVPKLSPEKNFDSMSKYSQNYVDALDLHKNVFVSLTFDTIIETSNDFPFEIVGSQVEEDKSMHLQSEHSYKLPHVITFERLLSETSFVLTMRDLMSTLQQAYECPVDIEFTTNFRKDGSYQINLVQCRPLQTIHRGIIVEPPQDIKQEHTILDAYGAIIGPSLVTLIDRIIYIVPSQFGLITERERYSIARLIGRLTHLEKDSSKVIMLIGPGRWGTSIASLGVPVKFTEINTVSVLCEIVEMHENLIPDVSLGTHFFNDIVETKMLYFAVFPQMKQTVLNKEFFEQSLNILQTLLPDESKWLHVIKVIDRDYLPDKMRMVLNANTIRQRAFCYLEKS